MRKLLPAIRETPEDYDAMEDELRLLFRREIYIPLLAAAGLSRGSLQNSLDDLIKAIQRGRIQFDDGRFVGKFDSKTSRELRRMGARWDKSAGAFHLRTADMEPDLRAAIAGSESRIQKILERVSEKLSQILPAKIADAFRGEKIFDTSLWRLDRKISSSIKGITVAPDLTKEGRAEIARDYTTNMRLYIKDFAEKEIEKLRTTVQQRAFSGNRYEALAEMIQRSHDVSMNKAKFLARQETSILMAKFKKARYTEAGLEEYVWGCVRMPHDQSPEPHIRGNVRFSHGQLEGKTFRWSDPPITTNPGQPVRRNNPGEDYGCRCFARPVVSFTGRKKKAIVLVE